nr:hypothetical protein OG781_06675 [Streptomyces sp. NBC_00830]
MAPSTVEDFTVQVLGGCRVECGGEELPTERWPRPSARRLLKALALARGGRLSFDAWLNNLNQARAGLPLLVKGTFLGLRATAGDRHGNTIDSALPRAIPVG